MPALKDLTGFNFGYLKVKRRALVTQGKKIKYICECICGNETVVAASNLSNGHTISCGCKRGKLRGLQLSLPYGVAAQRMLYSRYKDRANRSNLEFDLEFSIFIKLTSTTCNYCGREPSNVIRSIRSNGDYVYNGIDRIDNSKGYILNNVVACCTVCNRAKGNMSLDEFKHWIKDFVNYNKVNI